MVMSSLKVCNCYTVYKYALNAAFACRNIYTNSLTQCIRAMLISMTILCNQPFLRLSEVHIPWDESILNAENLRESSKRKRTETQYGHLSFFQEVYELWQINDISVTLSILWVSHTPSRSCINFFKKKFARVLVAF